MKTGKALVIFLCAAILFAGCADVFDPAMREKEVGYLLITVEENGASTLAPPSGTFAYTAAFDNGVTATDDKPLDIGLFELSAGNWIVTVKAWLDWDGEKILAGMGEEDITVIPGANLDLHVQIKPWAGSGKEGSLSYNFDVSGLSPGVRGTIVSTTLSITRTEGESIVDEIQRDLSSHPAESPGRGTEILVPGLYTVTIRAAINETRFFTRTELAHVYPLCDLDFGDILLQDDDLDAKFLLSGVLPLDSSIRGIPSVDIAVYRDETCEEVALLVVPFAISHRTAELPFTIALNAEKASDGVYLRPELKDGGDNCYGAGLMVPGVPEEGRANLRMPKLQKQAVTLSQKGPVTVTGAPAAAFAGKRINLSAGMSPQFHIKKDGFSIRHDGADVSYSGYGHTLDPYSFTMPHGDVNINAQTIWGCDFEIKDDEDFIALRNLIYNVKGSTPANPYPVILRGINDDNLDSVAHSLAGVFYALEIEGPDLTLIDGIGARFSGNDFIISFNIPESVTTIENYAFRNCRNLRNVYLPESLLVIKEDAFFNCSSLQSLTIPESVFFIGSGAFSECTSLEKVIFLSATPPDDEWYDDWYGVSYSGGAFMHDSLAVFFIPGKAMGAYVNSSVLRGIDLNNLKPILSSPEEFENHLTNNLAVNTPSDPHYVIASGLSDDDLLAIGDVLRLSSNSNKFIVLDISTCKIEAIGDSAFNYCSNLSSILLPDSLAYIGDSAFSGCSSLDGIILPNSLIEIMQHAFTDCTSLTSIVIPDSVIIFGGGNWGLFGGCSSLSSITLGNFIDGIPRFAFEGCDLRSIIIPASVDCIGTRSFADNENLRTVEFHGIEPPWISTPANSSGHLFDNNPILEAVYVPEVSINGYRDLLANSLGYIGKSMDIIQPLP